MLATVYFWILALVATGCALGVLLSRHPLHGAISLIGMMLSLGGLFAVLASPFLAVVQVLVYAGAVMMLVVFVLMVLGSAEDHALRRTDRTGLLLLAPGALAAYLVWSLVRAQNAVIPLQDSARSLRGTVASLAARLFDTAPDGPGYHLLFELVGLALLSALVGSVLLARRSLSSPESEDA